MDSKTMIKGIIFDFNRTLYDPDTGQLVDGATTLLKSLHGKGYLLCLISKKSVEGRKEQITSLGLDRYFIKILIIEGNKLEAHFMECLKAMALSAAEVAVVGDRINEEILLGNKIGMRTIWYKSGKFAAEAPKEAVQEPDYTITDLQNVPTCLEENAG
ncbi:MAG: HAD hydrolase-like protein [Candidatus Marsarchaeota archaeon]|nr:HAD hydrolase-like protein [Candidatus Marsarchaeota archaeon]